MQVFLWTLADVVDNIYYHKCQDTVPVALLLNLSYVTFHKIISLQWFVMLQKVQHKLPVVTGQ